MSYLAEELARQFDARKLNPLQVSERSGISASQLYKWTRSDQTSISNEQLGALAPALSDDPSDHAALVCAHLMDEKFGPGADLVDINIRSLSELRDQPRPRSKGERALQFLAQERNRNRDLNDLLIDLARVLGADL